MPVAGLFVPDLIYNIGTTVLNGGVSMVIFFFVNKIIRPGKREAMEKISLYERRRRLITVLYERQNDTVGNLAFEFAVSSHTIRNDWSILFILRLKQAVVYSFWIQAACSNGG